METPEGKSEKDENGDQGKGEVHAQFFLDQPGIFLSGDKTAGKPDPQVVEIRLAEVLVCLEEFFLGGGFGFLNS